MVRTITPMTGLILHDRSIVDQNDLRGPYPLSELARGLVG